MLEPLLAAHEGRIHEVLGLGSFQEYCSRLFGWCGRTTRERIRVAKAMRSLPEMRSRWAAGELTYSVVRELTRVATPDVEDEWLAWATGDGVRRTVREVAQTVARHSAGSKPSDPPAPFEEQTVTIALRMSGSEATRYSEARAEATRRLGHSIDDETFARMLFDAFLMAPSPAEADPGRAPNQVRMTVCERCGATERQAGAEGLVPVDPKDGEQALCDAQVLRPGERAAQSVPPATRRAVVQRDEGKCAVPGCRHAAFVEVHHVTRRADAGSHDSANLVVLCSVHHDAAHRGRLVIRAADEPGAFVFERADGRRYGAVATGVGSCAAAARVFRTVVDRTGSEARARVEADRTRASAVAHAGREAGPAIPVPLIERVVGLLTAMGYRKHESRTLVNRAIAGTELPRDRSPTTEELLRASLRAGA